jgi:hypothetical protein
VAVAKVAKQSWLWIHKVSLALSPVFSKFGLAGDPKIGLGCLLGWVAADRQRSPVVGVASRQRLVPGLVNMYICIYK